MIATDCAISNRHSNSDTTTAAVNNPHNGMGAATYAPATIPTIILHAGSTKGDLFPTKRLFITSDLTVQFPYEKPLLVLRLKDSAAKIRKKAQAGKTFSVFFDVMSLVIRYSR
jgi:hypothetical protein